MNKIEQQNIEHSAIESEQIEQVEQESSVEIKDKAKQWIAEKINTFTELLDPDKKMIEKTISEGLDINLKERYEEMYRNLTQLYDESLDLRQLTDQQIDELEEQRTLEPEQFIGMSAEDFSQLPQTTRRNLLRRHGFSRHQVENWLNSESFDEAIDWAKNVNPQEAKAIRLRLTELTHSKGGYQKEMLKFVSALGDQDELQEMAELMGWQANQGTEFGGISKTELDVGIKQLFEGSIRGVGNEEKYIGNIYLLSSYLNLPEEQRDYNKEEIASKEIERSYPELVKYTGNSDSQPARILAEYWPAAAGKELHTKQGEEYALLRRMDDLLSQENGLDKLSYFHKECGIVNLHRFSEVLLDIQYAQKDKDLPYGAVILPLADHNGAFFDNIKDWDKLMADAGDLGMALRVGEAASVKKLYTQLKRWDQKYGDKNKIDFFVLAGHGTPESVALGTWYQDHGRLVTDNVTQGKFAERAMSFLSLDAPIAFNSCSTGKSKENTESIAQQYSRILETSIQAPDRDAALGDINISKDSNGKVQLKVLYKHAEGKVFVKGEGTN